MKPLTYGVIALSSGVIVLYAVTALFVPGFEAPLIAPLRVTAPLPLYAHLGGSALALALGVPQLSARLRSRALSAHRWVGRTSNLAVAEWFVTGGVTSAGPTRSLPSQPGSR